MSGKTRVALVGPGAIGLAFGAAASQAGHELVICGRRPIESEPVVELQDGRRFPVNGSVVTSPQKAGGVADVVLFAVKAHQTAGAADWLAALCGPDTTVVVLQNGVEHRELVGPFAGDASVLPVAVWCPAAIVGPGQVKVPGEPRLVTEAGSDGQRLADLLSGTFAVVELSDDIDSVLWAKLIPNAVVGLTVLTGKTGAMFDRADTAALGLAYARECTAVGRATGVEIPDSVADELVPLLVNFGQKTSMLVDREAGRQLEWDARNGVVKRLGEKHGVPTPISDVVVPLLAAASDSH